MKQSFENIIIIIPVYNEAKKIVHVIKRIINARFSNIVIIDDGSSDTSSSIIKKYPVKLISLKKHSGVGYAIQTGLEYALSKNYAIGIIMGGDDQDDPEEIIHLIRPIINQNMDFVQGSRYLLKSHNTFPVKKIQTKLYSRLFSYIVKRKVTDASNGFRALNLITLKNLILKLISEKSNAKYEFEPYLMLSVIENKLKFTEIPVNKYYNVEKGFTKMIPFISWFEIIKPLLKKLL